MSESDTPRTDAASKFLYSFSGQMQTELVTVEHAQSLERELNAANKRIAELELELRAAYERT